MKTILTLLITVLFTAAGTWFLVSRLDPGTAGHAGSERKPIFYQSPMHPWIKSDKPGRCTICGMELVAIYPGEKTFDSDAGENVVALSESQIQVLHVQTGEAKIQSLTRSLRVAGMIDDDATRHRIISAPVDGRIEKLYVTYPGAEVDAGHPLADYYSPALLQAEREYRGLTGAMRNAAALRLRQMGLTPEQIEAVTNKPADSLTSQILSPIGGTVVAKNINEGQYVSTGEKLFELADFSVMWFVFRAYEQDLPWIETGRTVEVSTPSLPGKSFTGKISFIDPNFDEATRSTSVRVELPNPKVSGRRALLHRLYADGILEVGSADVLTIPRSAVIQTGPKARVYLDRKGGGYVQTPVTIGRRGDALVEILSGLKEGDKVVTQGNLLIDGQAELNRSFIETPGTPTPGAPTATFTEAKVSAIRDFIGLADAMAAALAADDLAAFNQVIKQQKPTTGKPIEAPSGLLQLEQLRLDGDLHGFDDLKSARVAFLKFSLAATAVLEPLRKVEGVPKFQILECPMVGTAFPDAPKQVHWIQVEGRPLQNPFFGAEMLDCGKEIKP